MKTYSLDFTRDELCKLRCLISSEMSRASEILARTGNSDDSSDKELFSYWNEKYQFLKKSYDKFSEVEK